MLKMPLTPVIGSIYFLAIPLSTEPGHVALCHAQLISSFVLSLSWKTARSLDFRKLFPAVLFFPLSFFLGTCFDLETPTGFEWFVRDPASIKRLLRTIERLYLTMCLRILFPSLRWLFLVEDRNEWKFIPLAGERERGERDRYSRDSEQFEKVYD